MRLATHTFWWFLLPFAALVAGSFSVAQTRVQATVRAGLEASVKQEQAVMARLRSREVEHNARVLRAVSQNPALEAVVQQMLGDRRDPEARRTVEQQLVELGSDLEFDFLLVSDADRNPMAAVLRRQGRLEALDLSREHPPQEGYYTSGGETYEVTSVPINQGDENLGSLSVAERFDLSAFPTQAVLLRNGEIIETNASSRETNASSRETNASSREINASSRETNAPSGETNAPSGETNAPSRGINAPGLSQGELQAALGRCAEGEECEIQLRGETWVSQPLEGGATGGGYQVRSLENVDAAARDLLAALRRAFLFALMGALAAAALVSVLSSRSMNRPLSDVIARLQESARTGQLPEFDSDKERVAELRDLTRSFNRAAEAVRDSQQRLEQANVEFIESLASALDARDPYTAGHSRRVSQYACATAQAMGLAPAAIQEIRVGALLHDIGKIGISDAILRKPGGLTPEEDALIRQHPTIGRRILEGVNGFQSYLDMVELHHENWDGSGYPRGLSREQTPLAARVVKIADAWDAMTSDRPYRSGMSRNQALATLRKAAGTQMDPVITEVVCALWGADMSSHPVESLARLAAAIGKDAGVTVYPQENSPAQKQDA